VIRLLVALLVLVAAPSWARVVVDSAGRSVEVPERITRVLAAGPPASVLLYVLAPETMLGWSRAPRQPELTYLQPAVRGLPETGRLTGRGDTLNLERLIAEKPDIVVDFGTIADTYRSLADRVQAQSGIPYLLIDGSFAATPAALRLLGDVLGVMPRAEALARAAERIFADVDRTVAAMPAERRPRVYLARSMLGLETGSRGSINTEIIERVGAINVVEGLREKGGLVAVSPEQVLAWAPGVIITLDPNFFALLRQDPLWRAMPAVRAGRIHLAPAVPFGWIDFPPGLNRILGLDWLARRLYPDLFDDDPRDFVREAYQRLYHRAPDPAQLDQLLA